MKNILLTIVFFCVLVNLNAQYAHTNYRYDANVKEETITVLPSFVIVLVGFGYNEYTIRNNINHTEQNNVSYLNDQTATIYFTTAVAAIGTHYLIKNIRKNSKFKKPNRKQKYNSFLSKKY